MIFAPSKFPPHQPNFRRHYYRLRSSVRWNARLEDHRLPPFRRRSANCLAATPVLIMDGEKDSRRSPYDGLRLAENTAHVGATVPIMSRLSGIRPAGEPDVDDVGVTGGGDGRDGWPNDRPRIMIPCLATS
jgi:hypothetical protein